MKRHIPTLTLISGLALTIWLTFLVVPFSKIDADKTNQTTAKVEANHRWPSNTLNQPAPLLLKQLQQTRGMQGTEPDGTIQFNRKGMLTPNQSLKDLFDHLLLVKDQWGEDLLAIWFKNYLNQQFNQEQTQQVFLLFVNYQNYLTAQENRIPTLKDKTTASEGSGTFLEQIERLMVEQKQLRSDYFTEEQAQALFADEDNERETALKQYRQALQGKPFRYDDEQISQLSNAKRFQHYARNKDNLNHFNEQEKLFGTQAALRLAELEQKREHWQQRVDQFIQQRNQILQQTRDQESANMQIADLLEASFSHHEIARAKAISRLHVIPN